MSPRLSTWLIYPWITDIKITLGDVMKFYLPHQLMQRKSIFIQTGRATYITAMTMQSQGGTTNETKCNYCPPPPRFENKINPPAIPFGASKTGMRVNLSLVTTQRYNWLSCHYLDWCSSSSSWFPLADGSATIFFLTSMNWLQKGRITGGVQLLSFYLYPTETFHLVCWTA